MKYIIDINNLSVENILKNINLKIKPKTFNIIIGPNGSGKSTLLKTMYSITNFKGSIKINDLDINDYNLEKILKSIGVLQSNIEFIEKTVYAEIAFPLINLGYNKYEEKKQVYYILKKLGIEHLLLQKIETLSSSEAFLVSLASVLVYKPKILIIDNSLELLDAFYKEKIINLFIDIKNNTTIIMSSNNPEDLIYADEIIIINNGVLVQQGTLEYIFNNEKILLNANSKLPFMVDLSLKLKFYDLIDKTILNKKEMVDEIWK